jgi:photosystem II stability/assembly factor-like uncharacterized protein
MKKNLPVWMLLLWSLVIMLPAQAALSWSVQDSVVTRLTDIYFVDAHNGWIITETDTIYHTRDGGQTWLVQKSGSKYALTSVHFVDAMNGWAVGDVGTILHTSNGGDTWQPQTSGVYDLLVSTQFTDANKGWAVGEAGVVLHTVNGGATWSSTIVPSDSTEHQSVFFLDEQRGWVVGAVDESALLIQTLNSGASWKTVLHDTSYGPMRCVQFIDASTGWVGGMGGVILKTQDGGATWTQQFKANDGDQVRGLYFHNAQIGWAIGLKNKFLYTSNGGAVWDSVATPVSKRLTDVHFIDAENGWAITSAGGTGSSTKGTGQSTARQMSYILKFTSSTTAVHTSEPAAPVQDFKLYANYPNPFNPSTTISFQVSERGASSVQLIVYDAVGRQVRSLVNQAMAPGQHDVRWDGNDESGHRVASGVYFYRMTAGSFSQCHKMLLLY